MILAIFYVVFLAASFVFLGARHYYLISVKLNHYMSQKYPSEWKKMKEDTGWYRPQEATLYYSKAVYDFIWRSKEDFGDKNIYILKKKIKALVWQLPLYFLSVIFVTIMLIVLGVLK